MSLNKIQFNCLTNDKFLDLSELKAFTDEETNVREKLKYLLGSMENIVGKEENAGYQHFLLLPQFSKGLFLNAVKSWNCVIKGYNLQNVFSLVMFKSFYVVLQS